MYITVNGQQFHLEQAHKMGKEAFIKAHKSSVRNTAEVWKAIEKEAKKTKRLKGGE